MNASWQTNPAALRQLASKARSGTLSGLGTTSAASWQTDPAALMRLAQAAQRSRRMGGFGSLGLSPVTGAIAGKVAGTVGGAAVTSAATAGTFGTLLSSSAVAGPIGLAAGAIIAIAISVFDKNYVNVSQWNASIEQHIKAWQQYLSIQGHVAGRALGMKAMTVVMEGAVSSRLFPGNNAVHTFHEGTLIGGGSWQPVLNFVSTSTNLGRNLAAAYRKYQAVRAQKPADVPDAVYLIDNVLLPWDQQAAGSKSWIVNGAANPEIHQLLYDVADAWLAQYGSGTVPYVEYPASQIQSTAGAIGAPAAGMPATSTVVPTTGTPTITAGMTPIQAAGALPPSGTAGLTQIGTDPVTGVPIYQESSTGTEYEYVNGQLTPYVPSTTTATGVPTTGGLTPSTMALIQSLLAQGQSQTQAYTSALQSLAAQGVNTQSPAVQAQVAQAVQAPSGTVAGMTAGTTGMTLSSPGVLIGLGLLGIGVVLYARGDLKKFKLGKHSK